MLQGATTRRCINGGIYKTGAKSLTEEQIDRLTAAGVFKDHRRLGQQKKELKTQHKKNSDLYTQHH
jgi:hypothetical protein